MSRDEAATDLNACDRSGVRLLVLVLYQTGFGSTQINVFRYLINDILYSTRLRGRPAAYTGGGGY